MSDIQSKLSRVTSPISRLGKAVVLLWLTGTAAFALAAGLTPSGSGNVGAAKQAKRPARPKSHLDHRGLYAAKFKSGPEVTEACIHCHPSAATEVMHTQHFTWVGEEVLTAARGTPNERRERVGKRNLINNYCISIESNWPRCTSCHAGYGWSGAAYDFTAKNQVDCLVCHDRTGTYRKELAGLPAKGVDLNAVAESVGRPGRDNCGSCHFSGGGGDAVKHGDLDSSLSFPPPRLDVHMGRERFSCVDCHVTRRHEIPGRSMSVGTGVGPRVHCTDCHDEKPHGNARLDAHTDHVACPTCHIPFMAVQNPTKMVWDWSTAGQDVPMKNPHHYLKEKGSFVYASRQIPEYYFYQGRAARLLKGDVIDPTRIVELNRPLGAIGDKQSKIWPFKVNRGKQPYDAEKNVLLVPKTYGEGGYWTQYDWNLALKLGAEASGTGYSGKYGFVTTKMYWPLAHMVAEAKDALDCKDCHAEGGRMDWVRLGYDGDPAFRGGRRAVTAHIDETGGAGRDRAPSAHGEALP